MQRCAQQTAAHGLWRRPLRDQCWSGEEGVDKGFHISFMAWILALEKLLCFSSPKRFFRLTLAFVKTTSPCVVQCNHPQVKLVDTNTLKNARIRLLCVNTTPGHHVGQIVEMLLQPLTLAVQLTLPLQHRAIAFPRKRHNKQSPASLPLPLRRSWAMEKRAESKVRGIPRDPCARVRFVGFPDIRVRGTTHRPRASQGVLRDLGLPMTGVSGSRRGGAPPGWARISRRGECAGRPEEGVHGSGGGCRLDPSRRILWRCQRWQQAHVLFPKRLGCTICFVIGHGCASQ